MVSLYINGSKSMSMFGSILYLSFRSFRSFLVRHWDISRLGSGSEEYCIRVKIYARRPSTFTVGFGFVKVFSNWSAIKQAVIIQLRYGDVLIMKFLGLRS